MAKFRFNEVQPQDNSEEVANDAMQLFTVATFNGLCRVIAALAENGLLNPDQIQNIHDAMTDPLDDPDWRDDQFVADSRTTVERVLAKAITASRQNWELGDDQ